MKVIIALLPLLLVGCSTSLKDSLDEVSPGMDKADVLEISGSPWLTRRASSQDTWVYRYYDEEQEFHRQLVFANGKIVSIGPARKHPHQTVGLKETDSIEEYTRAVEKKQQDYQKGFKELKKASDDD